MKKLTLDVEMLRVESFAVSTQGPAAGLLTIVEATRPLICDPATVPPRCA